MSQLIIHIIAAILHQASLPAVSFDPSGRTVVIENPSGAAVWLEMREDDTAARRSSLGNDKKVTVRLGAGRYVVIARDGETISRRPLPIHRWLKQRDPIRIKIDARPDTVSGYAWIPGGVALKGDAIGVGQEDERPVRLVDTPGFFMKRTEVTNEEFVRFLNDMSKIDEDWLNLNSRKIGIEMNETTGRFHATRPDHPVITVSWHGATAYARWISRRTGHVHRLPTETEWEKAARGPESNTYAYGNIYRRVRANQESGELEPVARYGNNGWGLADMTGNAFEWVADVYPHTADAAEPPRVLRGGSFVLDGMYLRNSFRMFARPSVQADDFGFRLLRERDGDRR